MLREKTVPDAEDVDQHSVLTDFLANHHVALGDDVDVKRSVSGKVARERQRNDVREEVLDAFPALEGGRVVLDVVLGQELVDDVKVSARPIGDLAEEPFDKRAVALDLV